MPVSQRGLYEALITEILEAELEALGPGLEHIDDGLRSAEAADRIALHVGRVLERSIASVPERDRAATGISLARTLLGHVDDVLNKSGARRERPVEAGRMLRAVVGRRPDGLFESIEQPLIPLLDTALLTNAPGEPRVGRQIVTEIASADRIDVVMAFIRRSGIAPFLEALRKHCSSGRQLRVLTTTYTGSTEARALAMLEELGAEVRVSYDTSTTRLHAKSWLFHRESGFSTVYVGSSNLTHSAQVTGLEWNVRLSAARNRPVVEKVGAVFESYWQSDDFKTFDPAAFAKEAARSQQGPADVLLSPIELTPRPFQERMLEQLELARSRGHHRNLLVSATGTGKTVMAAVDYARLRQRLPRARLLFVAHRKEILMEGARPTFCQALRDPSFGELWVDGRRPADFEHVFASIQSLNAGGLEHLKPDHFDVVIIDEFHHAAAASYRKLLDLVEPRELLGLTATPERSDGLDVLRWFDGRIAAELRLWDAIDQHRLSPFVYYGIHDGIDLRDVPWKRGRGYDVEALTNVLTANDVWARQVIHQLSGRVDDVHSIRCFGFCVSVEHARFMARVFNQLGIASSAVWGDSSREDRRTALAELRDGKINVLFSVDLFNEGIDLPALDTLLMLRPTDSPVLFLQQLGRGLRRSKFKDVCTVLDFVGHQNREFRFDRRFRALIGGTRREIERQIEQGFPFLPAGCHMELDRVASEIVLESIRSAIPSRWPQKVEELRVLAGVGEVTLASYLDESGLDLEDVYTGNKAWSDLCDDAGVSTLPPGTFEKELRRGIGRLLHIDDPVRLGFYRDVLSSPTPPNLDGLDQRERRLLRMLVASVASVVVNKSTSLSSACSTLWSHPQVRHELLELLGCLETRIDHVHVPLATHPEVPLQVHGRYTRIEILAAFGVGESAKVAAWQTGIRWVPDAQCDLLAFTLDKTSGQFSPTTRYKDYAISRNLIHWESQSVTRAASHTGLRYQRHEERGSHVMLFSRLNTSERAFWFLGPARYVSHEGELPMAITWALDHKLPGDLYARFAAAVA